jgi:uncharacterized protein with HEPN domain
MAKRTPRLVITEMVDAIDGIEAAINGKTFEDFKHDWLLQRGVERGIEILSEAARHLPDELTRRHPSVPWAEIRGIGNVLRHEYHKIAERIIWSAVTSHLPTLKAAVLSLRDETSR